MNESEWRPSRDLVDWTDAIGARIMALQARIEAGEDVANAEATAVARDAFANLPAPLDTPAIKGLLDRLDAGEQVAAAEIHEMFLSALANPDTGGT